MAEVKIAADSGGGSVGLKGPASTTSNAAVQFKLPVADGTAGQVLKTDGSGNLSWTTPASSFPTHLDVWLLTSAKNWSGTNTFTDWERITNADFGNFGAAMTYDTSTGIFTFPATGIWHIAYQCLVFDGTENAYTWAWIDKTTDGGSNFATLVESSDSIPDDGSNTVHGSPSMEVTFDVQNTTNYKVKFKIANEQGAQIGAANNVLKTGAIFTRIGDT